MTSFWTHQPGRRGRVRGIIEPGGVGFVQSRGEDGKWEPEQFSLRLRPWQFEDGPVESVSLYLWKRARLPRWLLRLLFRPGGIAEFAVERDAGSPQRARILRYRGPGADNGLSAALTAWRAGRTLSDPRFGTFGFDERVEMFETRTQWRGHPVQLILTGDEKAALARAHSLFDAAEAREAKARAAIRDGLLDIFNENWRDQGEPIYSADEFLAPMKVEAIAIDGGAFIEIEFGDGGLFLGHAVIAKFDEEEGETWAELAG